jgi:MscS family membrane protein
MNPPSWKDSAEDHSWGMEKSMKIRFAQCVLLLGLTLVQRLEAQATKPGGGEEKGSKSTTAQVTEDPLGRSTPWGTVFGFIKAIERGNNELAGEYLDSKLKSQERRELARELGEVLNRKLSTNLERLSRKAEGDLEDGLRDNLERIGVVENESGSVDILLVRVPRKSEGVLWLFSPQTLEAVPQLYAGLDYLWIEKYVPKQLRTTRWFSVPVYRWLSFPIILILALGAASILSRILLKLFRRILHHLAKETDERKLATMVGPLRLLMLALFLNGASYLTVSFLGRQFWRKAAATLSVIALAWLMIRLMDVVANLRIRRMQRLNRPGDTALARLLNRLAKVTVAVAACLILLSFSGTDLTAVLTGLGLGGVAIAFAAQKTLENVFGGIMVISDKPVEVGDVCRAGEFFGEVEDIGLRSTRIRTMDRTVVSIPNGQLATLSLENFTRRDRIWLHHSIALRYETKADQLRYVLAEIRRLLYSHPKVDSASARVRFIRFGGSSLELEIFAYVLTTDFTVFLGIQEDLLLHMMDIVESSGTSVALSPQMHYIVRDPGINPDKGQEAINRVQDWRRNNQLPFPDFHEKNIAEFKNKMEYPSPESAVNRRS